MPTEGYAVGDSVILMTTNGGASWERTLSNTQYRANAVHFPVATTGYTVGSGRNIIKTTDSGKNWSPISIQNTNYPNFYSVYFTDSLRGCISWNDSILQTTDGGLSWTKHPFTGGPTNLQSLYFVNNNVGYGVGWYLARIIRTTNGGASWTTISQKYSCYSVYFSTENTGYALGQEASDHGVKMLKTTDGGTNWTKYNISDTPHSFSAVFFTDVNKGYVVGDSGIIYQTTDGGISWRLQSSGTTATLYSVHFPTPDVGYAVGYYGTILKYTTTTDVHDGKRGEMISSPPLFEIYPNPVIGGSAVVKFKDSEDVPRGVKNFEASDMLGRVFHKTRIDLAQQEIYFDVSGLSNGLYLCVVSDGENFTTKKMLVIH